MAAGLILGYIAMEYSIWYSLLLHISNNLILGDVLPRIAGIMPGNSGNILYNVITNLLVIPGLAILVLLCASLPYMSIAAGPVVTLSNLVRMLNTINLRDGDIFAPQDAVGALWIREKDLEMTWKLYSEAVKTADADIRLWANCENFTLAFADTAIDGILTRPATENTEAVPATLDRFTRQMKTAAKYAENIITFSYNHYYSPELVSPAYIETYLDYVKNGYVLEGEAPVMGGFRKSAVDGGVSLDWDAASDNFGIAYYRIEKNGKFLTRIETCYSSPELVYADIGGSVGDEYTITAYDAAGNVSAAVTAK